MVALLLTLMCHRRSIVSPELTRRLVSDNTNNIPDNYRTFVLALLIWHLRNTDA